MTQLNMKDEITTCHSEALAEGSYEILHCVQNDNQVGRSMVEMLGVLAVIGVLSVAGIAGYTNAMNKHRVNELLNEASKRAVVVAMQIASGKTGEALSISEFGNNTVQGVNIEVDTNYTGGKTFTFNLSSTGTELTDICPKVIETTEVNSFMKVEPDCRKITFNADLSNGVITNENLGDICDINNPCLGICQECFNGYCRDKCAKGESCAEGSDTNTTTCKPQPTTCSSCTSDQYCEITSSTNSCSNPDTGTCLDKESDFEFENMKTTIIWKDSDNNVIRSLDVYKGNEVTWWTAKNWCEAHGKQMVTLADLGIDKTKLGNYFSNNLWCGGNGTAKCSEEGVNWSALTAALGNDKFWTKEAADARYRYRVYTTGKYVNGNECWGGDIIALCK